MELHAPTHRLLSFFNMKQEDFLKRQLVHDVNRENEINWNTCSVLNRTSSCQFVETVEKIKFIRDIRYVFEISQPLQTAVSMPFVSSLGLP